MYSLAKVPFILHMVIETAAARSFIAAPQRQLRRPSPEARLVLQSYGGLLLATSLLCASFVARPGFDDASRAVALSLAFYHAWPARRAYLRIVYGAGAGAEGDEQATNLGGPGTHLVVHVLCGLGLVLAGLFGGRGSG